MGHGHGPKQRIGPALLLVAAVGYIGGMMTRPADVEPEPDRPIAGPGYTEALPAKGPADAAVVIVEVADYKCRFCGIRNGLVKRLMAEHRDVRFVFKHFPFVSPTASLQAAIASMAANRQNKFWEYTDQLFLNQTDPAGWTDERLAAYAETLGLDAEKFAADMKDPLLEAYVTTDKTAAEQLQVRATPTLLVNGKLIPNDATPDTVRMMVRDAAAQVQAVLDSGEATTVQDARAIAASRNHPLGSQYARLYMENDVRGL